MNYELENSLAQFQLSLIGIIFKMRLLNLRTPPQKNLTKMTTKSTQLQCPKSFPQRAKIKAFKIHKVFETILTRNYFYNNRHIILFKDSTTQHQKYLNTFDVQKVKNFSKPIKSRINYMKKKKNHIKSEDGV